MEGVNLKKRKCIDVGNYGLVLIHAPPDKIFKKMYTSTVLINYKILVDRQEVSGKGIQWEPWTRLRYLWQLYQVGANKRNGISP